MSVPCCKLNFSGRTATPYSKPASLAPLATNDSPAVEPTYIATFLFWNGADKYLSEPATRKYPSLIPSA